MTKMKVSSVSCYLMPFALLLVSFSACLAAKASCRAARKCCDGKDGDCLAEETSPNAVDEPCYCDHGCLEMGDCCPDFKDYCGVIDCQVSEWSAWSSCDVSCEVGESVRSRVVVRPEANGGDQCPPLNDKRTCSVRRRCQDRNRVSPNDAAAPRETAVLLPGKYAIQNMMQEEKYDVRSNLKSYKKEDNDFQYCAIFHVDKAMRSCQMEKDSKELRKGHTVCVMCDAKAKRDHLGGRCAGHGAEGKRTRFKNLMNPRCHGKWTRLRVSEDCPCRQGPDFVFV